MAMAISVREVYEANFGEEMNKIAQCSRRFPISSFDTEFPGTIFTTPLPFSTLSPSELFGLMSRNVNALKLIQLGLTLSDALGNLPQFRNEFVVWQFNFANFDENVDAHDPESICLLKRQGINFEKNKEQGIQLENFGREFKKVLKWSRSTWITFDGRYDYGYLIKILTGCKWAELGPGCREGSPIRFG